MKPRYIVPVSPEEQEKVTPCKKNNDRMVSQRNFIKEQILTKLYTENAVEREGENPCITVEKKQYIRNNLTKMFKNPHVENCYFFFNFKSSGRHKNRIRLLFLGEMIQHTEDFLFLQVDL